jgi:hypothetical protein
LKIILLKKLIRTKTQEEHISKLYEEMELQIEKEREEIRLKIEDINQFSYAFELTCGFQS